MDALQDKLRVQPNLRLCSIRTKHQLSIAHCEKEEMETVPTQGDTFHNQAPQELMSPNFLN